jgi:hypothetical protein
MHLLPTIAAFLIMRSSDTAALVERASSVHRWIAVGYIGSLLLAALFSYLLWVSGNKVQDALRADADAQIEQIKSDSEANAREASERIAALNRQAEELRLEAETARKEIGAAKAEAAKANERTGTLELETAQQREKAAVAERSLLELQQRVQDRHLTAGQRMALTDGLTHGPKGEITIMCVGGNPEPCVFAEELAEVLRRSGWTVVFGEPEHGVMFVGISPKGVFLRAHSATLPRAAVLQQALKAVGIEATGEVRSDTPEDWVNLLVGYKP